MAVEIYSSGDMVLTQNTVSNAVLQKGGNNVMNILSGGTAVNTAVNSGGNASVFHGGLNSACVIASGGNVRVESGGSAKKVELKSGGNLYVSGSVEGLKWTPCEGHLTVYEGGEVSFASSISGVYYGASGTLFESAQELNDKNISGLKNSMFVMADGQASALSVANNGALFVYSGGTAKAVDLQSGGKATVLQGGTVENIAVSSGGTLSVYAGGSALNIDWMPCLGTLNIDKNAYVTYTSEYSGVYYTLDGKNVVNENTVSDMQLANGHLMYVMSGGNAENIMLDRGRLIVSGGGTASIVFNPFTNVVVSSAAGAHVEYLERDADIYYGSGNLFVSKYTADISKSKISKNEKMIIYSGGTATEMLVESAGQLHISGGHIKNVSAANNGMMYVSDGIVSSAAITSGGCLTIYEGNAENIIITKGTVNVSNGNVTDTIVEDGYFYVTNGTASAVNIKNGAIAEIYKNGFANDIDIISAYFYCHGSSVDINVGSGGNFSVIGNAEDIIVNSGGRMNITSGGTVVNITVAKGGSINIESGANVSDFTVSAGGIINVHAAANTYASGIVDGTAFTMSNGKVEALKVTGHLRVASGGGAADTVVASKGLVTVSSGGILTGDMTIQNGGKIVVSSGGIVEFSLLDRDVSAGYILNNAALLQESPTFTLNVTFDQAEGTYKLAQGAKNFSHTITVISNGAELGTVTVGETLEYYGASYTLNNDKSGNLTITVTGEVIIPPAKPTCTLSNTELTNENVYITALFSTDSVQKQYSFDKVEWFTYTSAVEVTANGTVYFRGINDRGKPSDIAYCKITNIDKEAPSLEFEGIPSAPTNKDFILTAVASDGIIEYFENGKWVERSSLLIDKNGTYLFRATDAAGNITEQTVEIDMIDKVPPTLEFKGIPTVPTNQDIVLSAVSDGTIEYFDGTNWIETAALTVKENGSFRFRATDAAGNVTEKTVMIDMIDKVPPTLKINGNTANWINHDIILNAIVSDGVVEYFDNGQWVTGSTLTVIENGEYFFRVTDAAGNVTEKSVIVDKIDRENPVISNVAADISSPTNTDIRITADFSDANLSTKRFKIGNSVWQDYVDGVIMTENGIVYFMAEDLAGNTAEYQYEVDNIIKEGPVLNISVSNAQWTNKDITVTVSCSSPIEIIYVRYSTDGENWLDWNYDTGYVASCNQTVFFKTEDEAGNIVEKSIIINNIDKIAPALTVNGDIDTQTNKDVTLEAVSDDNTAKIEYSFDTQNWLHGSTITVNDNCTVYFRASDAAGNVTETTVKVNNIDKIAPTLELSGNPAAPTNQDAILTAVASDGTIEYFNGIEWVAGSSLTVSQNGIYRFRAIDAAGNITEKSIVVDQIDKTPPTLDISGNPTDWTYKDVVLNAIASDGKVEYWNGSAWTAGSSLTVSENGEYFFRATDAAGNVTEKTVDVSKIDKITVPYDLYGTADILSWVPTVYADKYQLELIEKETSAVLSMTVEGSGANIYSSTQKSFSWQISADGSLWINAEGDITLIETKDPQRFVSENDGIFDLFFAGIEGEWGSGYSAQYIGLDAAMNNKSEKVVLAGKNRIIDIFEGSADANILVLTDDKNGDALFVDDIFSASAGSEKCSRLTQIKEIRAGAGHDVVDLTSSRFVYTTAVKVHGGSGNDVIWANNGNNTFFGDAGNDRIIGGKDDDFIIGGSGNDKLNGGGGNDTFCFGGNFGSDTVEQLDGGSIILWFDAGSENNWDEETLTYSDGTNSVKVIGTAAENITLRFGDTAAAPEGAFEEFTSDKIFEDKALLA